MWKERNKNQNSKNKENEENPPKNNKEKKMGWKKERRKYVKIEWKRKC